MKETIRSLRRGVAGLFKSPDLDGAIHASAGRAIARLRVGVAFGVLLASIALPGVAPSDRMTMIFLVCVYYLPLVYLMIRLSRKADSLLARLAGALASISTIAMFTYLLPDTLRIPGLACYMLIVGIHTSMSGAGVGFVMVPLIMATVAGMDRVIADDPMTIFQIGILGMGMVMLVALINTIDRARRASTLRVERLHEALGRFTVTPDLAATMDSVSDSARQAVAANEVLVTLRKDDPDRFCIGTPFGQAMLEGKPVIVQDVGSDERMQGDPRWGHMGSMVTVPLYSGAESIGVMTAFYVAAGSVLAADVDLLAAYSEQASLVISRAIAYEHQSTAIERLRETDTLKSEFIQTMSHELRTPLTIMNGFVRTVLVHGDGIDDLTRRELLERASAAGLQMTRLVDQLITFSGLKADRVVVRPIASGLKTETDIFLERFQQFVPDHEIELDIPHRLRVMLDPLAFAHVMSNLLDNAAKFSPQGSKITVHAKEVGGEVIVSVRDEGCGIPEAEHERIFDSFYRARGDGGVRGPGIGLTVVKHYVEQLGGRVWVESSEGLGSTFWFSLRTVEERPGPNYQVPAMRSHRVA